MGPIGPNVAITSIATYRNMLMLLRQARAGTVLFIKSVHGIMVPKE
jgi:hypothetical protein